MSFEQKLDAIELHNQCFYSFDLGVDAIEDIVSPYYKQYKRDEGK